MVGIIGLDNCMGGSGRIDKVQKELAILAVAFVRVAISDLAARGGVNTPHLLYNIIAS